MSLSGLARLLPGMGRYEVHWEAEVLPDRAAPAPTISGACFCMRKGDFEAMGGFDEGYFLHVEDVDLCWRVRRKGGVVLFHPQARVIHLGSTSQKHPLFIDFTIWASAAHGLVMLIATPSQKGLFMTAVEGLPLLVMAAVLWRLKPR